MSTIRFNASAFANIARCYTGYDCNTIAERIAKVMPLADANGRAFTARYRGERDDFTAEDVRFAPTSLSKAEALDVLGSLEYNLDDEITPELKSLIGELALNIGRDLATEHIKAKREAAALSEALLAARIQIANLSKVSKAQKALLIEVATAASKPGFYAFEFRGAQKRSALKLIEAGLLAFAPHNGERMNRVIPTC